MNQVTPAASVPVPLTAGRNVSAIVPADAEQAWRMAQLISRSGMAPKDMREPEKLVVAIFHGLEVGLKPMAAVQSIAVVNGRPCIWGDAAIGLVQGSGLLEDIEERLEGEGETMRATCRLRRAGQNSEILRSFSVSDAKRAKLWNKAGPWTEYPQRMLQMRARSWALRDGFADVLKGLHVTEEARDFAFVGREARDLSEPQERIGATKEALLLQARAQPIEHQPAEPEPATDAFGLPPIPDPVEVTAAAGEAVEAERAEKAADPDTWPLCDAQGMLVDHLEPEAWLEGYEKLTRSVQSIEEGKALRGFNMTCIGKLPKNRQPRVANAENAAVARLSEPAEQPSMV